MGMFDEIKCEYPLPKMQDCVFQTKDLECEMGHYLITREGRLIHHTVRWEEVPEHERPYYGKPEWDKPIYQIMGMIRTIPTGDVDLNYHGDICFYGREEPEFVTFRARFTHGTVESIVIVP